MELQKDEFDKKIWLMTEKNVDETDPWVVIVMQHLYGESLN